MKGNTPTMLDMTFAVRLREIRISLGLTQSELARRMGVSQPRIAEMEKGEYSPTLSTLQKIANALKINPHELLEEKHAVMA